MKYVLTCNCGSQDFDYEMGATDKYICTSCGTEITSMEDEEGAGFLAAVPETNGRV